MPRVICLLPVQLGMFEVKSTDGVQVIGNDLSPIQPDSSIKR
jgi:hypothetical protein